MAFAIDRQEIINVATRNKHQSVQDYVESLLSDKTVTAKAEAAFDRMELSLLKFQDAVYGSALNPSKLSSSVIKLANKAGDYIQFDGAGFKISASGNLSEKFSDFGRTLASLAADANTSLKSVSFGTKAGVVAKLDLTSTEIKVTVGKEVFSVKGDFPTKLGQVYQVIKETTGLDSKTGFDIAKLKLLALKPGAELSKFDIDSITLTSDKLQIAKITLADTVVKATHGKIVIEAKGSFPGDAGEVYSAVREMLVVKKGGIIGLVQTIGKSAALHDYDIDSISVKNGNKVIGAASFTTKTVAIQVGDYKLTAAGSFPHSAADVAQMLIDAQAGKSIASFKLTSLKLVDLKDGSTLASASGTISSADALTILNTVSKALGGSFELSGTAGVDKISGGVQSDYIYGFGGNDELRGGGGKDELFGGKGNDKLYGDGANDRLHGDVGADQLYGGTGADTFIYRSVSESTNGSAGRDMIHDFSAAQKDKIDLKAIDANTKTVADNAFTFVGTKAFTKKAGELRYEHKDGDTYVTGDVNGDGKADFTIVLDTTIKLVAADFIL